MSTQEKLTLIAGACAGTVGAETRSTSWNAHRRRCTRVPGMLNSSKNPSPRTQKSTDVARSVVGIVTKAGMP
ncbi:hypothetical protein [Plantactinospora sp. B24E8]|uniref:hypothetical protein n=1 Tax=Plantactinospora sp. B24E8 TaxID=3153567 RepID=UPI00325E9E3B